MAGRAGLRASDADRDGVADRLRQAATEGRLLTEELERRLEAALSARTYGELDAVVEDLPGSRVLASRGSRRSVLRPALALAIAFPLAVASIVIAVLVITGVMAMWWFWLAVGWFFFGRHRSRVYYTRYGWMHGCSAWHSRRPRAHPSRGFWA
ncbi:MAG TPA: DUF1707 domain-containing protein [Solirubrobacteraceae bacterium]|nr:DUF1707 domain-containing protein [Solirubrobacteraceae bacterium]